MSDSFSEVTTTSWGKRITDSFVGMLVGLACFVGAFVVLWWGEGRSIDRIRTLDAGRELVVSVSADDVLDENEGKMVHFSAKAEAEETIGDEAFGIEDEEALKLKRTVQMYQWKEEKNTETKENMGGSETTTTTYEYKKDWSESLIDSSEFKKQGGHENPAAMPYESEEIVAEDIYAGDFWLDGAFVSQMSNYSAYKLTNENLGAMGDEMAKQFSLSGGEYFSGDAKAPKVGDLRVSYEIIRPYQISIVGKQSDGYVIPYTLEDGEIALLSEGKLDAPGMFAQAESENALLTWAIRAGGIALMWMGLALMFRPIRMIGAVVPFIGNVMGAGIGLIAGVIAIALGGTTIALAWLFYRPIIGAIVLAVTLGLVFGGWRMMKSKVAALRNKGAAAETMSKAA